MLRLLLLTPLSVKDVSFGGSLRNRSVTVVDPPEMITELCINS